MKYITTITLNGEIVKTFDHSNKRDWDVEERFVNELKSRYDGQISVRECGGGNDGYYIGFVEKEKKAFCIGWHCDTYTDFIDIDGKEIKEDDVLLNDTTEYRIHQHPIYFSENGYTPMFYLRRYEYKAGYGGVARDTDATQEKITELKLKVKNT